MLHFDTMVAQLMSDTHGNLYAANELNRFAELSTTDQIRLASNSVKMSKFAFGWDDEHDLSEPLTGAIFDILVDVFQEVLVDRGVISRQIADMSDNVRAHPEYETGDPIGVRRGLRPAAGGVLGCACRDPRISRNGVGGDLETLVRSVPEL